MLCRAEVFLFTFGRLLIGTGVMFRMWGLRSKTIQLQPPATLGENSFLVTEFHFLSRPLRLLGPAHGRPDFCRPFQHLAFSSVGRALAVIYEGREFEPFSDSFSIFP